MGNYDYFVFLDDDLELKFDLAEFEKSLEKFKPLVAAPTMLGMYYPQYIMALKLLIVKCARKLSFSGSIKEKFPIIGKFYSKSTPKAKISTIKHIDHAFMAIEKNCAASFLPYDTTHDSECWWKSGMDFCNRFWDIHPNKIMLFSDFTFNNLKSRPYPRKPFIILLIKI